MQGGKNWIFPKEKNANRFFGDSHWLEIWSNHLYPSMGPNVGSVAMDYDRKDRPASLRPTAFIVLNFLMITLRTKVQRNFVKHVCFDFVTTFVGDLRFIQGRFYQSPKILLTMDQSLSNNSLEKR